MVDYTKNNKKRTTKPTNSDNGFTTNIEENNECATSTMESSAFSSSVVTERNILKNVYLWMTMGLAVTGITAWIGASSEFVMSLIFGNSLGFLALFIGQLVMVWVLSARIMTLQRNIAILLFLGYSALMGLTLTSIFWIYELGTISLAFFSTAGMFGGMSLWALTTKKDLSGWGHFLMMGLWGIIFASIINLFVGSSAFYFMMSYVGIAIFLGFTAYDTFIIKKWYQEMADRGDEDLYTKLSIIGALKLYLDFVNIFLYMLRILGRKR